MRGAVLNPSLTYPARSGAGQPGIWLRRRALRPEASWAPPHPTALLAVGPAPRAAPHQPQHRATHQPPACVGEKCLRLEWAFQSGTRSWMWPGTYGVSVVSSGCHYVQTEDVTTCICSHRTHLRPKVTTIPLFHTAVKKHPMRAWKIHYTFHSLLIQTWLTSSDGKKLSDEQRVDTDVEKFNTLLKNFQTSYKYPEALLDVCPETGVS